MDTNDLLDMARGTIDTCHSCFAITVTSEGEANARIVLPHKAIRDWTIVFATQRSCRKLREIESSGKLTLAYQDDAERAYVSVVGNAGVVDDIELKRSRWATLAPERRELASRLNPKGPDDPDLLYIQLIASRIELWNAVQNVMPEPRGYSAAILKRAGLRATGLTRQAEAAVEAM